MIFPFCVSLRYKNAELRNDTFDDFLQDVEAISDYLTAEKRECEVIYLKFKTQIASIFKKKFWTKEIDDYAIKIGRDSATTAEYKAIKMQKWLADRYGD